MQDRNYWEDFKDFWCCLSATDEMFVMWPRTHQECDQAHTVDVRSLRKSSRATLSWADMALTKTLLPSAILWHGEEKTCFIHRAKHGLEKLLRFSGVFSSSSLSTAAPLPLKPKLSPGHGFKLWTNYSTSSSETTREHGGGHGENERGPSASLFYSDMFCSSLEPYSKCTPST